MHDTITPNLGQAVQIVRCDDGAVTANGTVWGIFPQAVAIVIDGTGQCLNFIRRQPTSFKTDGFYCVVEGVRFCVYPV